MLRPFKRPGMTVTLQLSEAGKWPTTLPVTIFRLGSLLEMPQQISCSHIAMVNVSLTVVLSLGS